MSYETQATNEINPITGKPYYDEIVSSRFEREDTGLLSKLVPDFFKRNKHFDIPESIRLQLTLSSMDDRNRKNQRTDYFVKLVDLMDKKGIDMMCYDANDFDRLVNENAFSLSYRNNNVVLNSPSTLDLDYRHA